MTERSHDIVVLPLVDFLSATVCVILRFVLPVFRSSLSNLPSLPLLVKRFWPKFLWCLLFLVQFVGNLPPKDHIFPVRYDQVFFTPQYPSISDRSLVSIPLKVYNLTTHLSHVLIIRFFQSLDRTEEQN